VLAEWPVALFVDRQVFFDGRSDWTTLVVANGSASIGRSAREASV